MGKYIDGFDPVLEETLLSLYTTTPYNDTFFVYDTIPPEHFATLGAAFSRTHERFQKRLLITIRDGDLELPNIEGLPREYSAEFSDEELDEVQGIIDNITETWRVPPENSRKFIQKWAQKYGHNSIKEMGNTRFVCENIPDITGKLITGHPLAHPQVKSSRYINWEQVLSLSEENLDVVNSQHSQRIIDSLRNTGEAYLELTDRLEDYVARHPLNQRFLAHELENAAPDARAKAERSFYKNAHKSILDESRYLLTPAMATSLACSMEVRALEDVVTDLLSSPLRQDNAKGQELWTEAKKVVPVLMGEKCHAGISDYKVGMRETFDELLPELFGFEKRGEYEVTNRTNFLDGIPGFSDQFAAAAISWHHGNGSFEQYYEHLSKNSDDVKIIIEAALSPRGKYDATPKALLIDNPALETLMDYGGDRDNHRHRRGPWLRQRLTTAHGYETPRLIGSVDEFKETYDSAMQAARKEHEVVAADEPYTAQLMIPFGFKCRRLLTWPIGQRAYYTELRSRDTGHDSYRQIAFDIADHLSEKAPLVGEHLRVDRQMYPPELIKNAREWYKQTGGETV